MLIELLIVIAIIGILSSVIIAALHYTRCKGNPKKCNDKTEQKEVVADKKRPETTSSPDIDTEPYWDHEPSPEEICARIPDPTPRANCLGEVRAEKNIQNCIDMYTYKPQ